MPQPTTPKLTEQQLLGRALKRLRKRADLTQEEAAERAGVVVGSWRRYEWGERDLSLDKVSRLAEAIGFTLQDVLTERTELRGGAPSAEPYRAAPPPSPTFQRAGEPALLTVRDRVQAGAWLRADDLDQSRPRQYPAARDPRFPTADQWLSEVVGDSVNRLNIFDGDLIQCVDAVQIGYYPRTDDIVEVERLRWCGAERELTVKQVEVTPSGVLLWPRSTNPRWSEPLALTSEATEEELEVRVRGLVLASIRRF